MDFRDVLVSMLYIELGLLFIVFIALQANIINMIEFFISVFILAGIAGIIFYIGDLL